MNRYPSESVLSVSFPKKSQIVVIVSLSLYLSNFFSMLGFQGKKKSVLYYDFLKGKSEKKRELPMTMPIPMPLLIRAFPRIVTDFSTTSKAS